MSLNITVKIHPVVLFQIVDSYERRNADSNRVIGTLLGSVDKGVVEATNCFCVPHKEYKDAVDAETSYALDAFELNKRVNPSETIVGWWATGNEVTNHSSLIHEYYSRECSNPVHVTLDTSLQGGRMGLKAYVCISLGVPKGKIGCMFTPVNVEIVSYSPELVGLQLCQKTMLNPNKDGVAKIVPPIMDLVQIGEAGEKLIGMLDQVLVYVEAVLNNTAPPDNAVGRSLLDLINSVPHMNQEQFSNMFNSNVKDLLMVITLSQLIKTQLQLNEKLTLLTSL